MCYPVHESVIFRARDLSATLFKNETCMTDAGREERMRASAQAIMPDAPEGAIPWFGSGEGDIGKPPAGAVLPLTIASSRKAQDNPELAKTRHSRNLAVGPLQET